MSIYLKISRVGRDENIFNFFQNGDKNCRVGTKSQGRSGKRKYSYFFFSLLFVTVLRIQNESCDLYQDI